MSRPKILKMYDATKKNNYFNPQISSDAAWPILAILRNKIEEGTATWKVDSKYKSSYDWGNENNFVHADSTCTYAENLTIEVTGENKLLVKVHKEFDQRYFHITTDWTDIAKICEVVEIAFNNLVYRIQEKREQERLEAARKMGRKSIIKELLQ